MNIVAADWLPYSLPLKRPWQTSRGVIETRVGRLLRLQAEDGRIGWGDSAPLPDFGISDVAAKAFAEETAYLDLLAQQAGQPLHAWLSGEAPVQNVAVNGNLGPIFKFDRDRVEALAEDGFSIIKFKVGAASIDDEIKALQQLAKVLPQGLGLRLDANGAWTFAEAQHFIDACAGLPIEGLEEPLAQPNSIFLNKLQLTAAFPLAIDESCQLLDAGFFHQPPVRRIIIKPARHGGLLASMEMALRAHASSLEVIVTSSLESACGLLACAQLAAAIAPDAIHGLATAEWFASETGMSGKIVGGRMALPAAAGLGFSGI